MDIPNILLNMYFKYSNFFLKEEVFNFLVILKNILLDTFEILCEFIFNDKSIT